MVKVSFCYSETTMVWEVLVTGVTSPTEAMQAFNAAYITAIETPVVTGLAHVVTESVEGYFLVPATRANPLSRM